MSAREEEKRKVLDLLKKGELITYEPGKTIPQLKQWKYLRVLEQCQPATIEEFVAKLRNAIGKAKQQGVKAVLTKLIKQNKAAAVIYRGQIFYLTKEKFDELSPRES